LTVKVRISVSFILTLFLHLVKLNRQKIASILSCVLAIAVHTVVVGNGIPAVAILLENYFLKKIF